jgi:predicted AAA+ superfamily ATPase
MFITRYLEKSIRETLDNHKVLFLLGARQVGKTTLVKNFLKESSGVMLNMDFERDRKRLEQAAYLDPQEAMRALGAEKLLIIDEAQRLPGIGRICKGWYDMEVAAKIILLGSASANLLDEAAYELTGRNEKLWLTPLLFQEIIEQQEWYSSVYPMSELHGRFPDQVRSLLHNRLIFGCYPEAYLNSNPALYLENLSSDYLLKDIFASATIRSPEDVRRLLVELAANVGQPLSVLQLATRLNLSRQTIEKYLRFLEGIFIIFPLPAYATDPIKEISRSNKYYFWDNGVRNALQHDWLNSDQRPDMHQLWENWIISEIFKQGRTFHRQEQLYFWQNRNGSTVDLIVRQGEKLFPFDIRYDSFGYNPTVSFGRTYHVEPKVITPDNFLEYIS